ncbi:MAG: right-handed parallel beta-helix repeat-containing protein [bacterium]|nr:right-handed parallel beta-helix repeat-containing protein [bacterium]
MSKFNKILLFVNVVIVIVIVIVIAAIATNAWTNPTANPPGGGGTLYYYNGNVGIGTAIPTAALTMGADKSFRLIGGTAFPASPNEGELFFKSDTKQLYTYANSKWQADRTIATKIVAASNSLNKEKADYVCTGTNDQITIQAAIDALGANGGAVYLLEGTFNISASINLDNVAPDDSGKAIIGAGAGTVLKVVASSFNVKVIKASNVSKILISQLMAVNCGSDDGAGINFNTVTYSKIDKVWAEGLCQGYGISFISSSNNIISENHIDDGDDNDEYWLEAGIKLYNSSNNIVVANNFENAGLLVRSSSNNNIISGNNIQLSGIGIWAENSLNNIISGNNIQQSNSYGMVIGYTTPSEQEVASAGNIIFGNNIQSSVGNGVYFNEFNSIFSGNNVLSNGETGLVVENANDSIISGNIFYDNGGVGAYDSIYLAGGAAGADYGDNNLISSNRIYDSSGTGYGINIANSLASNNYLVGNFIDGAGLIKPINDIGANTKYTDKTKMTLEKKTISTIGNYTLDAATFPQTYISFNPTGAVTLTLANGKAAGDLLILENIHATNSVSLSEGANVNLGAASRALDQYDTLDLIWNGSKWIEMKWSDN